MRRLVSVFLVLGCAPIHRFETADTARRGEIRVGLGGTAGVALTGDGGPRIGSAVDSEREALLPGEALTPLVLGLRYGVLDSLELRLRGAPGSYGGGVKLQAMGAEGQLGRSLSLGLEGEVASAGCCLDTYNATRLMLPIFYGVRTAPDVAWYIVPEYALRWHETTVEETGQYRGVSSLVSSVFGVALGARSRFHIQLAGLWDIQFDHVVASLGLGWEI